MKQINPVSLLKLARHLSISLKDVVAGPLVDENAPTQPTGPLDIEGE